MSREAWICEEGTITITEMDSDGTVHPSPTHVEDFVQTITGKSVRKNSNFLQPGATAEDFKSRIIGHDIHMSALYLRGLEQIAPFQDDNKLWQIQLALVNIRYDGTTGLENDTHTYKFAKVSEGPDWEAQDNEIMKVTLGFRAETKL